MKDNFKRGLAFTVVIAIICTAFITAVNFSGKTDNDVVYAADNNKVITLQIDNPQMTVNDEVSEIDPGNGTTPVIVSDRTLVPIRAIIEAMGGSVDWDNDVSTVNKIQFHISNIAENRSISAV
jgi:hypothetical protein